MIGLLRPTTREDIRKPTLQMPEAQKLALQAPAECD
jgi:hypothetical protein